jgi:hypothetical protein
MSNNIQISNSFNRGNSTGSNVRRLMANEALNVVESNSSGVGPRPRGGIEAVYGTRIQPPTQARNSNNANSRRNVALRRIRILTNRRNHYRNLLLQAYGNVNRAPNFRRNYLQSINEALAQARQNTPN